MLQPKRTKYRKTHKVFHTDRKATKGNNIEFGDFGLQAVTSAWVTARQIEATRIAITRKMGREGHVIIRIFPQMVTTSKAIGTRMGKGKGAPEEWVSVVKEGTIMFEVSGVDQGLAKEALRLGGHKLPVSWKIVSKEIA